MTRFVWADGFHPPKGVDAESVWQEIEKLPEPSPPYLLKASKKKSSCLHNHLWSEPDEVLADRWRLERCRKIIQSVCTTDIVSGKEITIRAVEFVRESGDVGKWATMETISQDPDLRDAYFAELQRRLEQDAAKIGKMREYLR